MGLKEDLIAERDAQYRSKIASRFAVDALLGKPGEEDVFRYCATCDRNRVFRLIGRQEGVGDLYNCIVCDTTMGITA